MSFTREADAVEVHVRPSRAVVQSEEHTRTMFVCDVTGEVSRDLGDAFAVGAREGEAHEVEPGAAVDVEHYPQGSEHLAGDAPLEGVEPRLGITGRRTIK